MALVYSSWASVFYLCLEFLYYKFYSGDFFNRSLKWIFAGVFSDLSGWSCLFKKISRALLNHRYLDNIETSDQDKEIYDFNFVEALEKKIGFGWFWKNP